MNAEEVAAQEVASSVAKLAIEEVVLLREGEPLQHMAPCIEEVSHGRLCRVVRQLLLRFRATAGPSQPALEPILGVVRQLSLPAVERLDRCITEHQAFQGALSLTPLLGRAVVLAAQCCAMAVRGIQDVEAILVLTQALKDISEVLTHAVSERIERYRPLDSSRISAAHQNFTAYQASFLRALAAAFPSGVPEKGSRQLVLAPVRKEHVWKNEEIRQFWIARCARRHGDSVPLDVLATLLLRAAGVDAMLVSREVVMSRLAAVQRSDEATRMMTAAELDGLGPEVRRTGGLRAWVHALLLPGGPQSAGPGPLGTKHMAHTWGSMVSTRGGTVAGTATCADGAASGPSNWPASARTSGGSSCLFSARERRKPFALTSSLGRRTISGDSGSVSNPLQESVERGLLGTTQRLVLGEKVPVDPRHGAFAETPLHAAAGQDRSHAPLTALLLDSGADANAEDKHLATPLHFAASAGHAQAAAKLIQSGADVRKTDRWRASALHRAAGNGQADVAALLLQGGADATSADEWGATPLHRAVARGQFSVAESLLSPGEGLGAADVDAEDRRGDRPLHLAARRGDYALVRLLLEHGASASARSRATGNSAEDYAKQRGHTDIITLLQHHEEWVPSRTLLLRSAPAAVTV